MTKERKHEGSCRVELEANADLASRSNLSFNIRVSH